MARPPKTLSAHRWNFYRAGGVDQVRLDTGADIFELDQLDQKLWVALSCPVKGLEFDERTLRLLDSDDDAHVRPPEILSAIEWLRQVLKSPDDLVKGDDGVPLENINSATEQGKRLLGAAKHILAGLGKTAKKITVDDTMQTASVFAKGRHNGDGIVPPDVIEDAATKKVAQELVACVGGETDRSGLLGFDRARIERFFAECEAFSAWSARAESEAATLLPLGTETTAASDALEAVRAKIDDYFGRCALAAFDSRAQAALNREESAYLEVVAKDFSITAAEVAHFPLAKIEPSKPLSIVDAVNPAWTGSIARFREACVFPLLGKDKRSLTQQEWTSLVAKLAPHRAWLAARAGDAVSSLGLARVCEILAGKARAALEREVAADLAVAPEVDAITQVEKLARLHRDFHTLLNNYVSFTDFYARRKAIFQAGTLYLDGRTCDLCVHVNDPAKHGILAAMAKTYLAYVDCSRPSGAKMTVACAFTAGNGDNIFVGRNGLFYDRKGRDWNATITKIIDNPISIAQSFWSPYKKLLRWTEEQVAKRAAAADEASAAKLQTAAVTTGDAAKTGAAPAVKPKFDVGVVAALGVAVGGITGALAAIFAGVAEMDAWKLPLIVIGIVLAISGPSMLIAWLKLRQRNLGPILDANGWAVNTLTKVNIQLGGSLTSIAKLPEGASRTLSDPYAPKKRRWPYVLLVLVLLGAAGWGLWYRGYLHRWWPECPLPESPYTPEPAPESAPELPAEGAPSGD